jgi:HEPN domain
VRNFDVWAAESCVGNALDFVEDLQRAVSAKLKLHELRKIADDLVMATRQLTAIGSLYSHELGKQARTDLRASVDCIINHPSNLGMSRWHSLQAAEKLLKVYLKLKGKVYPKIHDLKDLTDLAISSGYRNFHRVHSRGNVHCWGQVWRSAVYA